MSKKTLEDTKHTVVTGEIPPRMKDRYTLRINSAEAKESKSDAANFMIELKCEIVKPLTKTFDGKEYALNGIEVTYWLMLKINDPETGEVNIEKTEKALAALIGRSPGDDCLHCRLGLPQEIDDENPDTQQYVGLVIDAIVGSREKIPQKPDPNNPKKWIAITDGEGKKISQGWEVFAQVGDILGLSKEEIRSGF